LIPSHKNAAFVEDGLAQEMYALMAKLYPICRSITGGGLRKTLRILGDHIPLSIEEVPTDTKVFDWTVPQEWNIKTAYIEDCVGNRIVDFNRNNLHVLGYSTPLRRKIRMTELRHHLFTLPNYPDWVPFRTSYFARNWGFCLTHRTLLSMNDPEYEVYIDSSLDKGSLTYGEYFLEGERSDEVLISTHICHPSLCNDNLSGIVVATFLAGHLSSAPRTLSYRFLFLPGTIGAISWLALNEEKVKNIKHGLTLACLGDSGSLTYKRSRQGNATIDMVASHVLRHADRETQIVDFTPFGYDERQYCSPGFNLPVGSLMRTPHGQFPEYHTSADNLEFVSAAALVDSYAKTLEIFSALEANGKFLNLNPKCEPRLGERGLYRPLGTHFEQSQENMALLWVLNLSDGTHSLLDIAQRSNLHFDLIRKAADALKDVGLLEELKNTAA
jgi:aminopeptidase-like protein